MPNDVVPPVPAPVAVVPHPPLPIVIGTITPDAISNSVGIDKDNVRVILIKNSLDIGELYMSEVFWDAVCMREDLQILSNPDYLHFDEDGNIID